MVAIHPSALKHGLTDDAICRLWLSWREQCLLEDDNPERVLRICLDDAGRAYELVGLVFDDDRVMVIHAMRLRPATAAIVRRAR